MPHTVAVAFSGGRDSLALLHATCRAAQTLGLQVVALHIHHGLLPEADAWLARAQRLCTRWRRRGFPLQLRWARLSGQPAPGESLEAWARAGRYAALARLAGEAGASLVLLAHHRRDQAETVLLQALRGGGPAGLSAMPASVQRAGLTWARPWLAQPHAAIDAYVRRHRLRPVIDPSNADPSLARSRLRGQVWPALSAAFGDAEGALAAAARRAQEAQAALTELAAMDLAERVDGAGRLRVAAWRQLSLARQANALRAWWQSQTGRGAPDVLVARLLTEVPAHGAAQWPAGQGWRVLQHRGWLQASGDAPPQATDGPVLTLDLSQPGHWPAAGWGGTFEVVVVAERGVAPALLRTVTLRPRGGGERFQFDPRSLPRGLKKQFQAAAVPVEGRGGPLVWAGDGRLLFVPGLGLDARCHAPPGAPQLGLRWRPDPGQSAQTKAAG
ncbi:MAG: tRNA lysidine(34) synthetase TilS [Aquabacterium sp.]|nr:tRNA lysidine(34) synthetase TilS [Aquabacterium sp.]